MVDAAFPSEHCTWEASQSTLDADLSAACRRVNTTRTSRTAALSLWGDFAQYHTRDSICLLLWNFLSGRDHRRFWAIAFTKRYMCRCGCGGAHTYDPIWEVLGWSLRACLAGHWPTHRHDHISFLDSEYPGDRLRARRANGANSELPVKSLLLKKCGDWQWMKQSLKLCGWKDGPRKRCCWFCLANHDDLPYWDPSPDAAWRPTVFTTMGQWYASNPSITGVFGWPAFTIWTADIDWMHSSDLGPVVSGIRSGSVWGELGIMPIQPWQRS